jgi:gas vesicle protein
MSRFDYILIGVFLVCIILWAVSNSLPHDVWLTALGVLLGGIISAVFSWGFARRATEELRTQAERLRDALDLVHQEVEELQTVAEELRVRVDLVHRGMEEKLDLKFTRDPSTGKRGGIQREAEMTSEGRSSMGARAEGRHKDDTLTE